MSRRLPYIDYSSISQHLKEAACPYSWFREILNDNTTILHHDLGWDWGAVENGEHMNDYVFLLDQFCAETKKLIHELERIKIKIDIICLDCSTKHVWMKVCCLNIYCSLLVSTTLSFMKITVISHKLKLTGQFSSTFAWKLTYININMYWE